MAATYKSRIMTAWNWEVVETMSRVHAAEHTYPNADECVEGCDDDGHVGSRYLGKHWDLFPSGRFYAPWSAAYAWERQKDQSYAEALEAVAAKHGGWIESGEGDPTDVNFSRYWTNEEISA